MSITGSITAQASEAGSRTTWLIVFVALVEEAVDLGADGQVGDEGKRGHGRNSAARSRA
jgi:hypothetical protein